MGNEQNRQGILFEDSQLGPFPMHRLKRVERPTSLVTARIQRVDGREGALGKAARGDYGPAVEKAASIFLPLKYPISAAQYDVVQHFSSIREEEVAATRAPIPEDPQVLSRHIKRLGYFLKADIVGICRLPKSAVYTHERNGNPVNIDYQNAIVLVVSKEYETVDASSGFDWIGDSLSFQAYLRLAVMAEVIASYIKKLGYPALPQSVAGGYQVLIPPLLLWAGIGEVSRAGIILNPFLGLGFKAAAVLTDMPLVPDMPVDFGLQDFCQHCQVCAEICPSKAISTGDKVMYNGYETWKLNEQRCASYSVSNKEGTICNLCVKVCPWTRLLTWKQNLFRWAVGRSSLTRKLALRSSKRIIRSKPRQDKKWWFDLQ
jgi:formate hydrogenlyase subunit 6/NADH:ubiquinone oxidoreductase subunit I